jgi:hypothetical protein
MSLHQSCQGIEKRYNNNLIKVLRKAALEMNQGEVKS